MLSEKERARRAALVAKAERKALKSLFLVPRFFEVSPYYSTNSDMGAVDLNSIIIGYTFAPRYGCPKWLARRARQLYHQASKPITSISQEKNERSMALSAIVQDIITVWGGLEYVQDILPF